MSVMERNHIKIIGEGTQVMMFGHGFGCSQVMWQYIVPTFEKDYRIILSWV
ncbi:alpha/beta fold hydrolase [Solibacillus sp. FSL K6-1523]|uniref:alpha/beta fold hydrolase n=1 Tax=Solibacillus sp. FSL K6-1523 TaxID=2921471 RepID=UPI0030F60EC0